MSVVVAVLAAAACDSVVTTRACYHSTVVSCNNNRHSAAVYHYLAQSSALGTPLLRARKTAKKNSTSCVPTTAAAAAAARPPQPINRASVGPGAVGFCCRPLTSPPTLLLSCCVTCGAKVALPETNKCLEKYSYHTSYQVLMYFEARPRERRDRGRFCLYTWLSFN